MFVNIGSIMFGCIQNKKTNGARILLINVSTIDPAGDQLINNEVLVYSSHFGGDLKSTYPGLYNATLPHHHIPKEKNDVRLQPLKSAEGFEFLSVSKNRHFNKGTLIMYLCRLGNRYIV